MLFSRNESLVLSWSEDYAARVWVSNADLDFPARYFPLWIQAVTGTEYDVVTCEVKTLDPERWRLIRGRYETVAADHSKTCKYSDANQWLRLQNPQRR